MLHYITWISTLNFGISNCMLTYIFLAFGFLFWVTPIAHAKSPVSTPQLDMYAPGEVIVQFKDGYNPQDIAQAVAIRQQRAETITGRFENLKENVSYHLAGYEIPENIQKDLQNIQQTYDATAKSLPHSGQDTYIYSVDPQTPFQKMQEVFADLPIDYVQPNYRYYLSSTPNDADYAKQWGFQKIHMDQAWDIAQGSSSVKVGIVDTGIDKGHPDLAGKVSKSQPIAPGCINDGDANGHGTHVAGVIGAVTNNAQGVAVMNWQVNILGYCVIGANGSGTSGYIAAGISAAADDGVAVINLSLGGPITGQDYVLLSALDYAASKNVVLVAAAGNCGTLPPGEYKEPGYESCYWGGNADKYLPGGDGNVISVAATGYQNEHAVYSNIGASVDLSAPGGNPPSGSRSCDATGVDCIYSTWNRFTVCPRSGAQQQYCPIAGTSMAAPHVTGLVALLKAIHPSLGRTDVHSILQNTAADLGQSGRDTTFGYGIINASASVQQASGSILSPSAVPTQSPTNTPPLQCQDQKEKGDYNCDSRVDLQDFETWRRDFELGLSDLGTFESFRQGFV